MAKIVYSCILAFLVIIGYQQVQANPFTQEGIETIFNIKDQILALVNNAIDQIKESIQQLNKIVHEAFLSAKELAASSKQQLADEYRQVINKITEMIRNNQILTKECKEAVDTLHKSYDELALKTNECVDKSIQGAANSLEKINMYADEIVADLSALKDETINCSSNIHGVGDFLHALKCVNMAGMKATWIVGKRMPVLTIEIAKLSANTVLLPPKIGYCFSTQFMAVVGKSYKTSFQKVTECISHPNVVNLPDNNNL